MRWRQLEHARQRLTAWIEERPLSAVISLAAVSSLTIVTLYGLLVQDAFQTYVWPLLQQSTPILNLIILAAGVVFSTALLRLNHEISEASKYRALATQTSPVATRTRLGHAEDQLRHALRNLTVSMTVLKMISDAVNYMNANPALIEQIILPAMKLVIESAQQMYAHNASRGAIWAPDPANPDFLIVIQHVNMDDLTLQRGRFYVGPETHSKHLQGTAGKVFRERKARVRHVNPGTHKSPDGKEYIKIDADRRVALYESFAAVPIVYDNRCLGVLCLDSPNPDCFGKDGDLVVLKPMAELLGELLSLKEKANELAVRQLSEVHARHE